MPAHQQRCITDIQVPIPVSLHLGLAQTFYRPVVATIIKLLWIIKIASRLDYHRRRNDRSFTSKKYAKCFIVLEWTLQLANDTIVWDLLFSVGEEWLLVDYSENAEIIEDLLDMWGAQIHTLGHRREHHCRETEVIVVKHQLGRKDIINPLMQLIPYVNKKEIALIVNIELDRLLESQWLSV